MLVCNRKHPLLEHDRLWPVSNCWEVATVGGWILFPNKMLDMTSSRFPKHIVEAMWILDDAKQKPSYIPSKSVSHQCSSEDYGIMLTNALTVKKKYPTLFPLQNQVGWPLVLCSPLFFWILHYWQYRLNKRFCRGWFFGCTLHCSRSGFPFSSVFSGPSSGQAHKC